MTSFDYASRYGMLFLFAVMFVVFLATNPTFRQPTNLLNILQQNSMIGIVACGMAILIIAGGLDLSVGAIGAAASVAGAALMVHEHSILLGAIAALAVGLAIGAANGVLVARFNITPFVATLGSSSLVTGFMLAATNALPVSGIPGSFTNFGLGKVAGIPIPAIVFAVVAIIAQAALKMTRFGHYIYALGSNRNASRLAGVRVDRVMFGGFMVVGLFSAIAGLILLGETGIGDPTSATTWPLTAIAAVVVGGTPLRGGSGGVHSAVLGTLLLGVLGNALDQYSVSPYWQPAITGAVMLLAVGADSYQRKRRGGDL